MTIRIKNKQNKIVLENYMYILIIPIKLVYKMYIVFVPFGWIRALSPVCF